MESCACCKHIDIFRLWRWWNSWLWRSGEAGELPDRWHGWHKTNTGRNETAHQQCECTETQWRVDTVYGMRLEDATVFFARFLDSWRVRHRQGWNCEPLGVSACHFKITRFRQVTNLWLSSVCVLIFTVFFTLTACFYYFSPALSRLCCENI